MNEKDRNRNKCCCNSSCPDRFEDGCGMAVAGVSRSRDEFDISRSFQLTLSESEWQRLFLKASDSGLSTGDYVSKLLREEVLC